MVMLTAHLGCKDGKDAPLDQANRRNGTSVKRLKGQEGEARHLGTEHSPHEPDSGSPIKGATIKDHH